MAAGRSVVVDGISTHLLEAGPAGGRPVLLLHGGAWGECAETAWAPVLDRLAARHRVIAPDLLGFGRTDKVRDFADPLGRMLRHVRGLLDALDVDEVDAVGLSMGGTLLLRDLTGPAPLLPVRRLVLVSAGGAPIAPDVRAQLADYDGTLESMRRQVALAFADPRWAADDEFVGARHAMSLLPGAYEAFAANGLRAPGAPAGPPPEPDLSRVTVPTLVTAGTADRLKAPGFAKPVADGLPDGRLREFDGAGHCPQIEAADEWTAAVLDFLAGSADPAAPSDQEAP